MYDKVATDNNLTLRYCFERDCDQHAWMKVLLTKHKK